MPKYYTDVCKKHGRTKHKIQNDGHKRCVRCGSEAVTSCRRKAKIKLVKMFGGKCSRCSYDKCISALTFHHRDPSEKEFGLASNGITRALAASVEEAKKCDLLCANCHFEIHSLWDNAQGET